MTGPEGIIVHRMSNSLITRRELLRGSLAVAATLPCLLKAPLGRAAEKPATKREPFKLAINIDPPKLSPTDLDPGWETTEIPMSLVVKPFSDEAEWKEIKARILSWKLPPLKSSSHFAEGIMPILGPNIDLQQQEKWIKTALARLAELGVEIAGVYGGHFRVPQDFPREQATEQALRFCELVGKHARTHKILIALEPIADPATVFPLYLEGVAFAKRIGLPEIRCMADLNYFIKANQALEDIAKEPEYCLHLHIANKGAQPADGERTPIFLKLFGILRDMDYTRSVSAACPWISTTGGELNYREENAKCLKFLKSLRAKAYGA
jgi:sugar phosphate isomerase/epimerase